MRSGCRGLLPLGRDRASVYRLLSGLREIVAEDTVHAAELRAILARPWPAPRVMAGEARRAA
jgi:hypothetical protein